MKNRVWLHVTCRFGTEYPFWKMDVVVDSKDEMGWEMDEKK